MRAPLEALYILLCVCVCVCVSPVSEATGPGAPFEALPTSPLTSLTVPPFGERRGHFWQLSIVVVVVCACVCMYVCVCVRARVRALSGSAVHTQFEARAMSTKEAYQSAVSVQVARGLITSSRVHSGTAIPSCVVCHNSPPLHTFLW